jgi:predicted RNase H-like HicB family nuclease
MKENYTFPAELDFSEKGVINLSFPDIEEAYTCVETGEDYISAAQEVLALALKDRLDMKEDIPDPSLDIEPDQGCLLSYLNDP